jgi:N-acetylneuraminate synthase
MLIIGEIGINHNGNLDTAKNLIKMAKVAGCDLVKFQKRDIHTVYTRDFLRSPRVSRWGDTQFDQKFGLEFNREDYDEIDRYCKEVGMDWFASCWDIPSLSFIDSYDLKYNKVASAMLTNIPFLEEVAKRGKHTFIATGMATIDDIDKAFKIFWDKCPITLLHCVSIYPCRYEDCNLKMINTLSRQYYGNCGVGYSNHSPSILPCVVAASLGATTIEIHITLDRASEGSDQASSMEENAIRSVVDQCRSIETILGDGHKVIRPEEEKCAKKLRYWTNKPESVYKPLDVCEQ